MRAVDGGANVFHGGFGGFTALFGLAAGAQAALAELDGAVRGAADQRLGIGVGADKLHALDIAGNHVLDGIAAAATDTDHFDLCALVELFGFDHFDGHVAAPETLKIGVTAV
ncbi:hypothetical protein D3C86_1784580 [compost metagenome]